MKYDLSKNFDKERFTKRVEFLIEKKKMVELTDITQRTVKQNSYLHVCLGLFACEYGESLEFVKEYFFKRLWNPDIFLVKKHDKLLGDVEMLRSSATLTNEEMITAIDRFKHFSQQEAGIFIPDSFSEAERREIEVMLDRNKKYL